MLEQREPPIFTEEVQRELGRSIYKSQRSASYIVPGVASV